MLLLLELNHVNIKPSLYIIIVEVDLVLVFCPPKETEGSEQDPGTKITCELNENIKLVIFAKEIQLWS